MRLHGVRECLFNITGMHHMQLDASRATAGERDSRDYISLLKIPVIVRYAWGARSIDYMSIK
jgi:hypothetical protein